jgi:hypothetical protein
VNKSKVKDVKSESNESRKQTHTGGSKEEIVHPHPTFHWLRFQGKLTAFSLQ